MPVNVGILVFDGVDELDFVGPLDAFSYAANWSRDGDEVVPIGSRRTSFRGTNGLVFTAGHDFSDAPHLDVIAVPGGHGTNELVEDDLVLEWLRGVAASARWICSVCTGAFVLQAAGLTRGRRITTHSAMIERLRLAKSDHVVEGQRYVVDGNIVTSAGVSAGIDMPLWVTGQIYGEDHARMVRANLEYDPAPPYWARDLNVSCSWPHPVRFGHSTTVEDQGVDR